MTRQTIVSLMVLWTAAAPIRAEDRGEIAVIEDVDGSIDAAWIVPDTYLAEAACAFYETHEDIYDVLFVFTTRNLSTIRNRVGAAVVRQDAEGIGLPPVDRTATFCARSGRLKHAAYLGDWSYFGATPDSLYTGVPDYPLTGLELLGHEFGHYWLVWWTYEDPNGTRHCWNRHWWGEPINTTPYLCDGRDEEDYYQHYSFFFNSRSVMYGSFIEEIAPGVFQLWVVNPTYAPVDQYLMGLREPGEVPPMFLVDTSGDPTVGSGRLLGPGDVEELTGTRIDFTVEDVIRSMGPRLPAREDETCHWKAAFAIVHPAGEPPPDEVVHAIDELRIAFEGWYDMATDHRGSLDTALDGRGAGTPTCPAVPAGTDGGDGESGDAGNQDAGPGDANPADIDSPDGDAGSPDATDRGADKGEAPDDGSSGCGCSVPDTGPLPGAQLVLLVIVLVRRRARWRSAHVSGMAGR